MAPPMVYISGEEMTKYTMDLILQHWIKPRMNISYWEFFDLSCKNRDLTDDQVLHNAVDSGKRIGAIFKEPTVTPTEIQKKALGLKKTWGSPNGAMRKGWNGITISRDTIHIEGMELGFKRPVYFDRHAVGGEYGAGWKAVGEGTVETIFTPKDGGAPIVVDRRVLTDKNSVVVTYDNPLDNVQDLAHHFFSRCLEGDITPYVVTKKTVFKWQEGFWKRMKEVFDEHYREKFRNAGLLERTGGELQHLISDAATMQIIRWTDGGFGMACHNYDGDMLTDEVSQVHRSPGFITSNLIGKNEDGTLIKEFEASHGTVADMWQAHLNGQETSLNPLGMVEALIGAMEHASLLYETKMNPQQAKVNERLKAFTARLRKTIHHAMTSGNGTRDLCGSSGLTTEQFVEYVAEKLTLTDSLEQLTLGSSEVDYASLMKLFKEFDGDGDGTIKFEEFAKAISRFNVRPRM
uniref:EF-hand domain-containing protein n=1 Tax=Arcella intermedia TaxID=1963864 RepID=A0A6B2L356_9EUKA